MKNKFCYVLLGLLLNFSFLSTVFAADYEVFVTANPSATTVVKGDNVSIQINVRSDSPVEMCQFQVSSDSNLEFVSINNMNLWEYNGEIDDFTVENDVNVTTPLTSGENVVQLNYKVNGDGTLTIKTLECAYVSSTNYEGSPYDNEIDDVSVNFKVQDLSDVNTLSNLTVTGGTLLTPITETTEGNRYIVELDSPNFGLEMTATNPEYNDDIVVKYEDGTVVSDPKNITFSGSGGQDLMLIDVTVNNKMTYHLLVNYTQTELDNSLKHLTINGEKLKLVAGQFNYEYKLSSDVTSFSVDAELNDSTNFKFGENSNAPKTFTINDVVYVYIEIEPVSSDLGVSTVVYNIKVTKETSGTNNEQEPDDDSNNEKPDNTPSDDNNNDDGNVNYNPGTGGISMYIMAVILVASLAGSMFLYHKNLENYK